MATATTDQRPPGMEGHQFQHMRAQLAAEIHEDVASALIPRVADLLASICGPVWSWGDGRGGWVWDQLAGAMADRGFDVSREHPGIPDRVTRLAQRDGWECHYCALPLGYGHAVVRQPIVEHVRPRSKGGRNNTANLVLACEPCNVQKGARTPAEWLGEPCCDNHSDDALGVTS